MVSESKLLEIINEQFDKINQYHIINEETISFEPITSITCQNNKNNILNFRMNDASSITIFNSDKLENESEARAYARYIALIEDSEIRNDIDNQIETDYPFLNDLISIFNSMYTVLDTSKEFCKQYNSNDLKKIILKETYFEGLQQDMHSIESENNDLEQFYSVLFSQFNYSSTNNSLEPLEIYPNNKIKSKKIPDSYVSISSALNKTLNHLLKDESLDVEEKQIVMADLACNFDRYIDLEKSYKENDVVIQEHFKPKYHHESFDVELNEKRELYTNILLNNLDYEASVHFGFSSTLEEINLL